MSPLHWSFSILSSRRSYMLYMFETHARTTHTRLLLTVKTADEPSVMSPPETTGSPDPGSSGCLKENSRHVYRWDTGVTSMSPFTTMFLIQDHDAPPRRRRDAGIKAAWYTSGCGKEHLKYQQCFCYGAERDGCDFIWARPLKADHKDTLTKSTM